MSTRSLTAAALAAAVMFSAGACGRKKGTASRAGERARSVQARFVARLDSLGAAVDQLVRATAALPGGAVAQMEAQRQFIAVRAAYKRTEYLLEYYDAESAAELNGPPIDEVEIADGPTVIEPAQGFQVLEGFLFPRVDETATDAIQRQAAAIRDYTARARTQGKSLVVNEANIFDAMRIEIARIATLGVTGFDSPAAHASVDEARHALAGIREALDVYGRDLAARSPTTHATLAALFERSDSALRNSTFESFDRMSFIVGVANPLAHAIDSARSALGIQLPTDPRFWRAAVPTLFDSAAFDADFFRPPWSPPSSPERVALGRRLFFEPRLSGSAQRSCATCHQPNRAFTDGQGLSVSLTSQRLRNAPTLINAALQGAQFADLSVTFLEDQIAAVVRSPAEMHGELETSANRLREIPGYASAFHASFGKASDSAVTPANVRSALATYIRTLTRLDSRFDRALRGDTLALDREEREGFNLFAGKALCATCHFIPLTNGTVPPAFTRTEQEVIGVPATPAWNRARVDSDIGRASVTRAALHRFAFKTMALRNVAITAPYMHNGVYRTLEEVVRFYDAGGGHGIGIELSNQTLPADSLHLTDAEKRALVRFLHTLSDTSGLSAEGRR